MFSLKSSETSEGKPTGAFVGTMFEKSVGALEVREALVSGAGVLDGGARGEGSRVTRSSGNRGLGIGVGGGLSTTNV